MLNVIRENLRYTKWVLWLIVLSFAFFFGPAAFDLIVEMMSGRGPAGIGWAVVVNGEQVPATVWQQSARNLEQQYRSLYGDQYEQIQGQIDLARSAADDIVRARLIVQDAQRMGLAVSDEEVARAIQGFAVFQDGGRFIGTERYRQLITRGAFPPYRRPVDFENALRDELVTGKWQALIAASIPVTEDEVREEYRRRHETVSLEYLTVPYSDYEAGESVDDVTLGSWYEGNRKRYSQGEGRRVFYVLFDDAAVADRVEISDEEIERFYADNGSQFERSEQRKARHILVSVEEDAGGPAVEAARARADELAARARSGEDFAELARQNSDEPGASESGGDLGFFGRGRMVPEFEQAVFDMSPGEIAGPVRTLFGFHVIKLEEVEAGGVQPLDDVRDQIRAQLRFPRLREAAQDLAAEFRNGLGSGETLSARASEMGFELRDAGIVTRRGSIPGIGPAPELKETIFSLEPAAVSDVVELPTGSIVVSVDEVIEDWLPPLDTQRERVLADLRRETARKQAREDVTRALDVSGGVLEDAARQLGVELRSTVAPLRRGLPLDGVGVDAAVEEAAFAAAPDSTVGPIEGSSAVVALRVSERTEADLDALAAERDDIEQSLRAPRAQQLIRTRLTEMFEAADIKYNPELIDS